MGDHGEVSSSSSVPMTTSSPSSWPSNNNNRVQQQQQLKYPYGHVTRGANKMLASYSLPGQVMRSNAVSTTTANGHHHHHHHQQQQHQQQQQHLHYGGSNPQQPSTGLMQPPSFNGGNGIATTVVLTGLHHHHQAGHGSVQTIGNGGSPSDEHSLPSSDIGEVDLDLWDLDINGPSVSPQSSTGGGHSPAVPPGRRSSDTSSTSGPFLRMKISFFGFWFPRIGRWHTGFCVVFDLKGRRHGNPALSSNKRGRKCVWRRGAFDFSFSRSTSPSFHLLLRPINQPCVWVCLCESKTTFQSCGFFYQLWKIFLSLHWLKKKKLFLSMCVCRVSCYLWDLVEDFSLKAQRDEEKKRFLLYIYIYP